MTLGPLQLIVIGFDAPEPDGSVLAELRAIREQGFIRLVDALGVVKDEEGAVWSVEASDVEEDEAVLAGAAIGALMGLGAAGAEGAEMGALAGAERAAEVYEFGLDVEDILAVADQIPPGGAALLMLVEHRWLIPLRDAIRAQGGIVYAQEFLSPETLTAIGSELALLAELEAGIEE
jgi:uncharacterized membrane protein